MSSERLVTRISRDVFEDVMYIFLMDCGAALSVEGAQLVADWVDGLPWENDDYVSIYV